MCLTCVFAVVYYSYTLCFGLGLWVHCLGVTCASRSFQFALLLCVFMWFVFCYRLVTHVGFYCVCCFIVVLRLISFALLFYYSRLVWYNWLWVYYICVTDCGIVVLCRFRYCAGAVVGLFVFGWMLVASVWLGW